MDERKPITFRNNQPPTHHQSKPTQPGVAPPPSSISSHTSIGSWVKPPSFLLQSAPLHSPSITSQPHPQPSIAELTQRIHDQDRTIKEQQNKMSELYKCIDTLNKNLTALKAAQDKNTADIKASISQLQNSLFHHNGLSTSLPAPTSHATDLSDNEEDLFSAIPRPKNYTRKSTGPKRKKKKSNTPRLSSRAASTLSDTLQDDDTKTQADLTQDVIHTQLIELLTQILKPNYKQNSLPPEVSAALEMSSRATVSSLDLQTINHTNISAIADTLHQKITHNLPNVKKFSKTSLLSALKTITPPHEK